MAGTSLLDCVRDKLVRLRSYDGEELYSQAPTPLDPEDSTYLSGLEPGTYKMWTARQILKDARSRVAKEQQVHEKNKQAAKDRKGSAEKMAAVKDLIKGFEELESALLEKGAKTFKELFPDIKASEQNVRLSKRERIQPAPFKVTFSFSVPDLTDTKREGYMRL